VVYWNTVTDTLPLRRRNTTAVIKLAKGHRPPEQEEADVTLEDQYRDASVGDNPPHVTKEIHELESSLVSERNKNLANEEELNDLRQQVKKLQEETDKARKMYEDAENEMKMKASIASSAEADKKKIKDLEDEVQHLNDKNKDLVDKLTTKEKKMSEAFDQIDALNKENDKLTDAKKHALKGEMKINPQNVYLFKSVTGACVNILSFF